MRALVSVLMMALCLSACAPPGYVYDAGSFTPRPINNQPVWNGAQQVAEHCGGFSNPCAVAGPPNANGTMLKDATPEFRAKAEAAMVAQRAQQDRFSDCMQYKAFATQIVGMKQGGASFDSVTQWASAKAYGPRAEVLRTSKDTETLLLHVVGAAYYGMGDNGDPPLYGRTGGEFADYAFKMCMSGKTF